MSAQTGPNERNVPAAAVLLAVLILVATAGPARAGQARQGVDPQAGAYPVVETQRLFDAYVLLQAQDNLGLRDAQLPDFISRLKVLQDVRRRHLIERRKIVLELQRRSNPNAREPFDEMRVRELLRSLAEIDLRGVDELRKAQEALDLTLDLRQQARFRVFEDQVERRKLDLLLRARRAAVAAGRDDLPRKAPDTKK